MIKRVRNGIWGKEVAFFANIFYDLFGEKVEVLKNKGNQFMKEEKYDEAVEMYTEAIEKDPQNHVLYSNRSAAYAKKEQFEDALKDAERTIEIKSDWAKVSYRLLVLQARPFTWLLRGKEGLGKGTGSQV